MKLSIDHMDIEGTASEVAEWLRLYRNVPGKGELYPSGNHPWTETVHYQESHGGTPVRVTDMNSVHIVNALRVYLEETGTKAAFSDDEFKAMVVILAERFVQEYRINNG